MKQKSQRAHRPNLYKLALGLLTHPDRQLSGAGHAGRSLRICRFAPGEGVLGPSRISEMRAYRPMNIWCGSGKSVQMARQTAPIRCGEIFEMITDEQSMSSGVRPFHEHRIFPVIGRGRRGQDHRQPGTEEGRIQARRPARMNRQCEQTDAPNPYAPSRRMLGRCAPASGAPALRGR